MMLWAEWYLLVYMLCDEFSLRELYLLNNLFLVLFGFKSSNVYVTLQY